MRFCAATSAEEIYRCRTSHASTYAYFTISNCPCDQVIRVRSADVGFSPELNTDNKVLNCLAQNGTCMRPATHHPSIMNCNGNRACWIPQSVLDYPANDKLCEEHQRGNFIKITYDCVNPGKRKMSVFGLLNFPFQHLLSRFLRHSYH